MPEPVISHLVPIHLTATSGETLSDATRLEETSKVELDSGATLTERKNLNGPGYTQYTPTWKDASGSLDYKLIPGSATQALLVPGGTAYLTIITDEDAGAMEEMGTRYEILFERVPASYTAGELVGGTASFKVNGAPTPIMGS